MNIEELWEGDMAPLTVNDKPVLLVNVDGRVRAYENRCPHQQSNLDAGEFDGETITCWRHLWQFDAATGRGINPRSACLTPYPCSVADDGTIFVEVDQVR
jgi:toluene monooxygenase system ferredoxin subunit